MAVNRQTTEGYSALHCAIDVNGEANLNTEEVIGVLVSAGADLKTRQHYGWTPLLRTVVEGTATEVKSLLAAGADPNETMPFDTLPAFNPGRTTLMAAVTNPEADIVIEALLQAGADPEMVPRESKRGEFSDKIRRCEDIVRQWLKKGRALARLNLTRTAKVDSPSLLCFSGLLAHVRRHPCPRCGCFKQYWDIGPKLRSLLFRQNWEPCRSGCREDGQ